MYNIHLRPGAAKTRPSRRITVARLGYGIRPDRRLTHNTARPKRCPTRASRDATLSERKRDGTPHHPPHANATQRESSGEGAEADTRHANGRTAHIENDISRRRTINLRERAQRLRHGTALRDRVAPLIARQVAPPQPAQQWAWLQPWQPPQRQAWLLQAAPEPRRAWPQEGGQVQVQVVQM